MAAIRQDIAGNDVYGKMDAFMLSRESLAGQPNVLAFMDAQSNNTQKDAGYIPFNPGAVLSQADMLLMRSGNVNTSSFSRSANDGETLRGDSEEAEEERNIRMTRAMVNAVTAQTMSYGGMTFTYEQVDANLSKAIEQQEKFLGRELREVKKEDLLYVDGNGRIVPADTPGARQVMTAEEKNKIESNNGVCTAQLAGDQVTFVDGKMVPTEEVMTNMSVQDKAADTKNILKKIESGEQKLEDLPDNIKAEIKEIQQTGSLSAVKLDTGPGVLGKLKQEDALNEIKQDYPQGHQQKMEVAAPAPVRDFAPAPGM